MDVSCKLYCHSIVIDFLFCINFEELQGTLFANLEIEWGGSCFHLVFIIMSSEMMVTCNSRFFLMVDCYYIVVISKQLWLVFMYNIDRYRLFHVSGVEIQSVGKPILMGDIRRMWQGIV